MFPFHKDKPDGGQLGCHYAHHQKSTCLQQQLNPGKATYVKSIPYTPAVSREIRYSIISPLKNMQLLLYQADASLKLTETTLLSFSLSY